MVCLTSTGSHHGHTSVVGSCGGELPSNSRDWLLEPGEHLEICWCGSCEESWRVIQTEAATDRSHDKIQTTSNMAEYRRQLIDFTPKYEMIIKNIFT